MGRAYKVERYSHNRRDGKVFWDIYYYHGGTKIHHLRKEVPKDTSATKQNGRLANMGNPTLTVVVHAGKEPRAPLKNKSNAQEKKNPTPPMQDQWKGWWNRWNNNRRFYHLEAVQ